MATVNPNILKKFRKATVRQQGDGDEAKVEVREDEEQSVKFQEIIDLLVAAGYFRARIKGLSAFDKVVGGITWCIDSCNVDIDVDLLFQENSTIGQKISLTEKIVAVLRKMKCNHKIEPHQIQGLDFIHIFPVVQWLVKKSMEFRQERSEFVRLYAVNQFNKTFDVKKKPEKEEMLENLDKVTEVFKPRRFYKRKTALPEDLTSRVQITLLEYGMYGFKSYGRRKSVENDGSDEQNQELQIQRLLSNMAISNETPLDFNSLNDQERKELFKHYTELQLEIGVGNDESKQQLLIEEQINQLTSEKNSLINEIKTQEEELENIKVKQIEGKEKLKEIETSIENCGSNSKEIEDLVRINDELKQKEIQFKEQCKKELTELEKKIQEAKNSKSVENEDDLTKELEEEMEKMKNLRLHLAKKNRVISVLQRQLDEVPSRPELAQYQRRFLELYNQVAAKHKETKQYFTLYNTLEDTKQYMKKELSLLNSISDSYPEAMMSNASREEFLKQLENIVEGVKQSKSRIELSLVEERQKRDQLSATLQGLVELQRKYVAAVRQLSIECKRYEALSARREEI